MQSDRWCEGVTGFGRGEADWVDDQVDRLNAVISSAVGSASRVTGADMRYVSVVEQFDNHGACRFWQRDRYVNDAVFGETLSRSMTASGEVREHWDDGPLTISGASFHPSTKGYDAVPRRAVGQRRRSRWRDPFALNAQTANVHCECKTTERV